MQRTVFEMHRQFQRIADQLEDKFGRRVVSALTTGDFDEAKVKLPKKKKDLIILTVSSHYLAKESPLRYLLQERLDEYSNQCDYFIGQIIKTLLVSKIIAINYILDSSILWKTTDGFFGNMIKYEIPPELKVLFLREKTPRRLEYHRGHRDKGSLKLDHQRVEDPRNDAVITELQNDIELQRKAAIDTAAFVEGFLW